MILNPSQIANFIIDEDGKNVRHDAGNTETNYKHFCPVFKMVGNLFIFYRDMATISISTVTDFKWILNINI